MSQLCLGLVNCWTHLSICRSQHFNSVNKRENNCNSHWRTSAKLKYVVASCLLDCCTSVLNIRQYQMFTSQHCNTPFKAKCIWLHLCICSIIVIQTFAITCRETEICWVNYRRVCELFLLMSACIFPLVSASGLSLRGTSSPVREWVYCSPTSAATSLLHQGTLLSAGFTDRGEDTLQRAQGGHWCTGGREFTIHKFVWMMLTLDNIPQPLSR